MKNCPIIGSFSKVHGSNEETYYLLANYIKKYGINKGGILPQFLPKRAWYFGGAVELNLFCHLDDKKYFHFFPDGICLDTAHLVMACNSARGDQNKWLNELLQVAGHLHIADAVGVDGEGINFGDGELKFDFFNNLPSNIRLIIEQWEGHLNNFKGFNNALLYLERLK
jgi:N-acetylneuraminate synthase